MKPVIEVTEFDKVREYIAENAMTEPGRLRTMRAEIFDDAQKIREQLTCTTEARRLCDMNLKLPLENFSDMTNSLKDAKARIKLSPQEIWDIANLLGNSRRVKNFLEKTIEDTPNLTQISQNLFVQKELEDKIFDTLGSDMKVKESASSELKRLYGALSDTHASIKSAITRLLSDTNFTNDLRDTIYTQR